MPEENMREVVRRLRSENSEAVLELLEFDYALDEFLRNFELLAVASQEVDAAVRNLATARDQGPERVSAAQDHAGRLNAMATQILGAFREMRGAVSDWNIAEARLPSSQPARGGDSSPI